MDNSKIKIFVLGKDKVNWSIDQDRKATIYFLNKSNFEITRNIFKATHMFCVWYDLFLSFRYFWVGLFKKFLRFKIITVITDDVTFNPEKIEKIKKYVDIFIAPSDKVYNFLQERELKTHKIPFFVDSQLFKCLELSKQEICKILKIDYGKIRNKILIGSFQRDSFGLDLTRPKWEKNPDLLIQILKKLPREKFIFLLAGPRRHYIIKQCKEKNIPYLFYGDNSYINKGKDDILANNLSLKTVNFLYGLTNIYLVASKSEGGPKQILESSLTKTLIFSTKVGLAPDILHPYLLFDENEIESLIEKIKKFFGNSEEFNEYIEYNFQKSKHEMDLKFLKEKYRKVILEIS